MNNISVSVTHLSEYVSRAGDLAGASYNSVSSIDGTRLHQRIFDDLKKQYGDEITTEERLCWVYDGLDGVELNVSGRLDALLIQKNKPPQIFEIKSFNSTRNSFKSLQRPEHLTQLKLYGAMYIFTNSSVLDVKLTLRYVSITTLESYEETVTMTYEQAEDFFADVCKEYAEFALQLLNYNTSMLRSVSELKFPYLTIRPGQKEFMKRSLITLTSKEVLFASAPTGIGKTISTLYPAIKGLRRDRYDKIFYLTAKAATRDVACKALTDLRAQGLIIRSILLQSKEQMCPYGIKCDSKFCSLAKNYYTKLRPAMREILLYDDITPELVREIAGRHEICPHELMVDTMEYCSVIIGDYNHIFHPRVSLMSEELDDGRTVVLADEAHNMVDRGRDMFSASFSLSLLNRMIDDFKGRNAKTEALLFQLHQYFVNIEQSFSTSSSAFKAIEDADERKTLKTENWEGMRQPPRKLYAKLWYTLHQLSPILDGLEQGQTRQTAMEFFFEARYFLTVLEQFFDQSYITCASRNAGDVTITLNCLDCSAKLDKIIKDRLAVIFFSATLSPFEYYKNVLVGKTADYVKFLSLSSPFPPENLEVILNTGINTTYKNRYGTKDDIAAAVCNVLDGRRGNYMIFFPSFEYSGMIMPILEKAFTRLSGNDRVERKIIKQIPDMTAAEKTEYLSAFSEPYNGVLLGSAVLGGHFGEGIDLVGDRLSGAIIVGVGVPKVTPERQIICNYYTEKFGDGFAFAYRFPGWQKVLQAVGRVIRTENDTGFALLIDERLSKPEYISLIPDNWRI